MESLNILIVDDSDIARDKLVRIITSLGHGPIQAVNGEKAIEMAREFKPDLIFMDVVMPMKDGLQATRQISKDPLTKNIDIIICSSKKGPSDIAWAKMQGAKNYIVKPYDRTEIVKAIDTAVEAKRARASAARAAVALGTSN